MTCKIGTYLEKSEENHKKLSEPQSQDRHLLQPISMKKTSFRKVQMDTVLHSHYSYIVMAIQLWNMKLAAYLALM